MTVPQADSGKQGLSVLFVCTANKIRSPIAAALFRRRLEQARSDWREWRIESAGTWGMDGEGASKNALAVMLRRGIDLSTHLARTVNEEMLQSFSLILTMEQGHKEALQIEFPQVAERVYMLSEMIGMYAQVDDPVGRPLPVYEETAEKIDQMLSRGMQRILELAGGPAAQDHNLAPADE